MNDLKLNKTVNLASSTDFYIGSLLVKPSMRCIRDVEGKEHIIEPRVLQALLVLCGHKEHVVSRNELNDTVWGGVVVSDDAINNCIAKVRRIGESFGVFSIETVPRVGYKLNINKQQQSEPNVPIKTARQIAVRGLGIVLVLVFLWLGIYYWDSQSENDASHAIEEVYEKSIAVLPFTNLSADQDQEYFVDGLTEELINKLAQVSDLLVTGRTSAFYFKDKNESLQMIGETLDVEHILAGSVRKSGNSIRINAQLIEASTGFELWTDAYDRELTDIFAVQNDISESVATALSIVLSAGIFNQVGLTNHVGAYQEFLKATQVPFYSDYNLRMAVIDHLKNAVRLDPMFALAWVALSSQAVIAAENVTDPLIVAELLAEGEAAIVRAREIAPDLPELLFWEAQLIDRRQYNIVLMNAAHTKIDEKLYDRIQYLNHDGFIKQTVGQLQNSLIIYQRAKRKEPLDPVIVAWLAQAYISLGRYEEALAEIEWGLMIDNTPIAALAGIAVGALEPQAAPAFFENLNYPGVELQIEISRLWAAGNNEDALALIKESSNNSFGPYSAGIYSVWAARLGDNQLASNFWSQYVGPLSPWSPHLSEMRKLPEFNDYLRKRGVVEYWHTTGNWGDLCRPIGASDFECD